MRKITTVRVEEELLKKAKEMGINLSKFLEYNLKKIIGMDRTGFEPVTSTMPRWRSSN